MIVKLGRTDVIAGSGNKRAERGLSGKYSGAVLPISLAARGGPRDSKTRDRPGHQGFALAEVLVACVIIGAVTVTLFTALTSGFGMVGLGREDLRATQIMLRKIEGLRLCTWSQLPTTMSFVEPYCSIDASNRGSAVSYNGTLTLQPVGDLLGPVSYTNNIRLVTVTVFWTNTSNLGQPIVRSRQMTTLVARYGMQGYLY